VRVLAGRMDFMIPQPGGAFERAAYLDVTGFHLDNVVAALPLPARLGLPSEEIAYLQLRSDTDELLIATEERPEGGYRLYTPAGESVTLVLAGLEDASGNAPQLAISFDVAVDDAFRIVDGSLEVDLSASPFDLEPFTQLPIQVTQMQFDGTSFTLGAQLVLPEALNGLTITLETLQLGVDGLEQVSVQTGIYTDVHQVEEESHVVISQVLGGGDLEFILRGIALELGDVNQLQISADLQSGLLQDESGNPALVHLTGEYLSGPFGR